MEVIRLHNIDFKYDAELILKGVCLNISKKEFLGIVGPNGGGKTTLLKIMLGILKPQAGDIYTNGTMSYVPQHLNFDKSFPISVRDVALMGLVDKLGNGISYSDENIEKANIALKKLGITNLKEKKFGELSGGQRQRALIARAIISNPDILILDEPTANIDEEAQELVQNILLELNKEKTIIMVSHHFDFITDDVSRVVCIDKCLHLHPTHKIEGKKLVLIDHSTDGEHSHD